MDERFDDLTIYCVQLGGEIPFRYCRTVQDGLPCRRVLSCWEFRIEITRFLHENYSPEGLHQAFSPSPRTRIETIVDLVEKAKRTQGNQE
jgi:hypothetical protein